MVEGQMTGRTKEIKERERQVTTYAFLYFFPVRDVEVVAALVGSGLVWSGLDYSSLIDSLLV